MSPVSLVFRTIITWVDLKDRIGQRPPVYRMKFLCSITQLRHSGPAGKHLFHPQKWTAHIMTSWDSHFVGGLNNKKARAYYCLLSIALMTTGLFWTVLRSSQIPVFCYRPHSLSPFRRWHSQTLSFLCVPPPTVEKMR